MSALSFTRNAVRTGTVFIMTSVVMVATADGFAQSYSGLYDWAIQHKLSGWKAESFPLLVDLFILVGELGLFLLALDGHRLRRSFMAWVDILIPAAVASVGWLVSLWFNVNHIPFASGEDKVTAGVPPVTAMVGLLILLRTVHRYMAKLDEQTDTQIVTPGTVGELTPEPVPEPEPEPLRSSERPVIRPVWHPSGFIADVPERKRPGHGDDLKHIEQPEPTGNGRSNYGKGPGHPKWDEGVKIYQESRQGPGKAMSQRDLAASLGMRNRSLAAAIIKYVKEN